MNLLEELSKAIESGNQEEIDRVKRKLLLADRDLSIDEDFIESIRGKTLYKNIVKSVNEDNTMDYLDYAKMVSSILTHCIIESQVRDRSVDDYPIKELYVILGSFINNKDSEDESIAKCKDFINERYLQFFIKENTEVRE